MYTLLTHTLEKVEYNLQTDVFDLNLSISFIRLCIRLMQNIMIWFVILFY